LTAWPKELPPTLPKSLQPLDAGALNKDGNVDTSVLVDATILRRLPAVYVQ
jgi:hypothetical protein